MGALLGGLAFLSAAEAPPVALRIEPFTVPPATGPVTHVAVQNLRDAPWRGRVALRGPQGWRFEPAERAVALEPKEAQRVPFTVAKGLNLDANRYPLEAVASGDDGSHAARKQEVFCASAPFYKPTIDGRTRDWADAIPVSFVAGGKATAVRTYWNRDDFCLLVEVEEERHVGFQPGAEFDAVQIAIASADKAGRYELLLVGPASRRDAPRCFLLARPGDPPAEGQEARDLTPLELKTARLAVRRTGQTTCYEAAVPFAAMPDIQATEGREFRFSLLVHDPDGTGLRDLGEAAGLWPSLRSRLAWRLWPGARWPKDPPFDSRIEWGFCSSKH